MKTSDEPSSPSHEEEERLAALLAEYDDALASGQPIPDQLTVHLKEQLGEDLECLHLLHHLRPDSYVDPIRTHPDVSNRYELIRRHAIGGIGHVWLARDLDLGREVALKELREERLHHPKIADRFLREARITGQLQHPGIVPVYELVPGNPNVPEEESSPFYTMRFVQGRTLTDAIREYHRKKSLGSESTLRLASLLNAFVSVCHTVAYAHSRGVIHRDLKGQNIVVGDFGEVMVLDWGLAKVMGGATELDGLAWGPDLVSAPDQTQTGEIIGTPAYMAPEQASGLADSIDTRTDVYGLGAILYEILTDQAPYPGTDSSEVIRQVREEAPARPDAIGSKVPPALTAICLKAMSRDPASRYSSAAEVGRDVQHWLADEPVQIYREPVHARVSRWIRRHKPVVAAISVLLFTGLIAGSIGTILIEQEQSRTAAVRGQAALEKAQTEKIARQNLQTHLYYNSIALAERELAATNVNRATQLLDACPEHLRGWEWNLLNRLCRNDPMSLRGHHGPVAAVAFGPDGKYLASAGHDSTVRIWDPTTGKQVKLLSGHSDVVYGVAFSPDGQRHSSASWDRTVKIWDTTSWKVLVNYTDHQEAVWRVAFNADGSRIATLTNLAVHIWDPNTGKFIRSLGETGGLNRYGLAYHPDGIHVATTTQEQSVLIWNAETGEEEQTLLGHSAIVKNVTFSPDRLLVASGAGDIARGQPGEVLVWDLNTGKELFNLRGHTDPIYGVVFSPDGRRLVSISQDHTAKVWDTRTGDEVLTIRAHSDTVRAVAFSPDGWQLVTAGADGIIKIWDASFKLNEKPDHELYRLEGHEAPVFSVAFHNDSHLLTALSDNETIRNWDLTGIQKVDQEIQIEPQIYTFSLRRDGKQLATATSNGVIHLLDPQTLTIQGRLMGHPAGPVKGIAYSPDGKRLAMAHWDRSIWIWDIATEQITHTLTEHKEAVICVKFSEDGKLLSSGSYDQTVCIWDMEKGKLLHRLTGHTSRVNSVAFSPSGDFLASASNDGTIKLWNPITGNCTKTLPAHSLGVSDVAFSPDGKMASAGSDWTVKLWEPRSGKLVQTYRGHADRVYTLAFNRDGTELASGSADHTVRIWDARTPTEMKDP
jgi:WD40 repeat protein/serine/threonine protein kinase